VIKVCQILFIYCFSFWR